MFRDLILKENNNQVVYVLLQCKCTAPKYLVLMDMTPRIFRSACGGGFLVSLAWCGFLSLCCPLSLLPVPLGAAAVVLPHTLLMLTEKCQLWSKYHCARHTSAWKCHMQLLSRSLSTIANFTFFVFIFFNLHQEPRNLYRLTQLLALVPKAGVQGCAGQITSAGRYCAAVYFGSADAIYSCVQRLGVTSSQELNLGLM